VRAPVHGAVSRWAWLPHESPNLHHAGERGQDSMRRGESSLAQANALGNARSLRRPFTVNDTSVLTQRLGENDMTVRWRPRASWAIIGLRGALRRARALARNRGEEREIMAEVRLENVTKTFTAECASCPRGCASLLSGYEDKPLWNGWPHPRRRWDAARGR